jgi:ubiquinone/menaquinone biosynthesis C-methylase UbiE
MSDSSNEAQQLAAAYDMLASAYDGLVQDDFWMRRVLRQRLTQLFAAGDRVLDVACGTGLETLFLAQRNVRMVGIDISPRTIERLREKARTQGLAELVEARVHDASKPLPWAPESFDGIVSTFAGLNTVRSLCDFAVDAHRVLKPHGRLLIHMLAPSGIWSRLPLIVRLRWRDARVMKRRRQFGKSISGRMVQHQVFPAAEVYHEFFRRHFELRRSYSLGFLWPQRLGGWFPVPIAYLFGRAETYLGRLNICSDCGRFLVLEMERSGDPRIARP